MSDETNSPNNLTEWERDGGEATLNVLAAAALGEVDSPRVGLVRGFIHGQPVVVLHAAFDKDNPDPFAGTVVSTPIAVLLLGDAADLVTFPEDQGTLVDNPDYVGPPVLVDNPL
jgi:hypothetical protein